MKWAILLMTIFFAVFTPFLGGDATNLILWKIRMPRLFLAFLAGGALAFSGHVFQSLFRNHLASPYTLGIASGASFGASLAVILGLGYLSVFSFLGAMLSVLGILLLAKLKKRNMGPVGLLLSGVIMGLFFSSLTLFMQALTLEVDGIKIMYWMMGNIDIVGLDAFWRIIPPLGICFITVYFYSGDLNLLSVSEDFAKGRGVATQRVQILLFIICSLMIAIIVSECGPLGFVGLIAPHAVKKLFGGNHRLTLPLTFIAGGLFLIYCDFATRILFKDLLLPLGVVTSLLGAPFFIYLLHKKS